MLFGMPTLLELKSLESNVALCRSLGLDFIELNMNMPQYQINKLDIGVLAETAAQNGIHFTIHLDENLKPCDFNDKVAAAYTETVAQTIGVARRTGIPVLNMHLNSGVCVTLPDRKVFVFSEYEQEYLEKMAAFRDACESAAAGADLKICVENCGDFGDRPFLLKGLELLLQSPVFALTFDIGHNAAAGYADEPAICKHISRLRHMHLHDARGKSNHLVLGEGDVDLMKYLKLAKARDCRVVIETKTAEALSRSVDWLRERRAEI
jgi:sugar phosphate isomerase/epimerase